MSQGHTQFQLRDLITSPGQNVGGPFVSASSAESVDDFGSGRLFRAGDTGHFGLLVYDFEPNGLFSLPLRLCYHALTLPLGSLPSGLEPVQQ